MRIVIPCLLILFSIGCKTAKETVVEAEPVDIKTVVVKAEDQVFMLGKSPCYGTCPNYTFEIFNNRYCRFIGKQHTKKQGTYAKFISEKKYKELVNAFEKADFFNFFENYKSDIADLPAMTIAYSKKGLTKTVVGKRERPEALHKLQFLLETIAESDKGWVMIKSFEESNESQTKVDKTKIVIDFAKPSVMARWFTNMKEKFGVQTIKSLDNNFNSWLIAYDTKKFKAEDIMAYLEADDAIRSAQFLTSRN